MFRFTIRDVLWLTALVAVTLGMGLAWQADHVAQWARAVEAAKIHGQVVRQLRLHLEEARTRNIAAAASQKSSSDEN